MITPKRVQNIMLSIIFHLLLQYLNERMVRDRPRVRARVTRSWVELQRSYCRGGAREVAQLQSIGLQAIFIVPLHV